MRSRSSMAAALADAATWYCSVVIVALVLLSSFGGSWSGDGAGADTVAGQPFRQRPCDEIYVVGEGETLNTISEKCGDPFIVEQNPHIQDPDDVFPGLVIKITPITKRR